MKVLSLILSITLGMIVSSQAVFASFATILQTGISQYREANYSEATKSLRKALQLSPGSDTAHYYLANSLLQLGQKNAALKEYKAAYMLATSEQMNRNCVHVLKRYGVKLPRRYRETRSVRTARATMTPYTISSAGDITKLLNSGKAKSVRLKDSHRGGPEKFTDVPETAGDMNEKWNKWIQDFRIVFNSTLYKKIGSARWALWGQSKIVFSVDRNQNLRSRIVSSSAPYFWDHYLLETTRALNKSHVLRFPQGSRIEGYNFTMGWNNGGKKRISRQTSIALRNIAARLRRNPITGDSAYARRLGNKRVRSSLSNQSVSATLRDKDTGAALGTAGKLQKYDAKVSGLILPKSKPAELKAKQYKLDPPPDVPKR